MQYDFGRSIQSDCAPEVWVHASLIVVKVTTEDSDLSSFHELICWDLAAGSCVSRKVMQVLCRLERTPLLLLPLATTTSLRCGK